MILIGRVKPDCLPIQVIVTGGYSQRTVQLEVDDILLGDLNDSEIQVFLDLGISPYRTAAGVEIRDTGSDGFPITEDACEQHIWFLMQDETRCVYPASPPRAKLPAVTHPKHIQPLSALEQVRRLIRGETLRLDCDVVDFKFSDRLSDIMRVLNDAVRNAAGEVYFVKSESGIEAGYVLAGESKVLLRMDGRRWRELAGALRSLVSAAAFHDSRGEILRLTADGQRESLLITESIPEGMELAWLKQPKATPLRLRVEFSARLITLDLNRNA